jgi:hypothetical protein
MLLLRREAQFTVQTGRIEYAAWQDRGKMDFAQRSGTLVEASDGAIAGKQVERLAVAAMPAT